MNHDNFLLYHFRELLDTKKRRDDVWTSNYCSRKEFYYSFLPKKNPLVKLNQLLIIDLIFVCDMWLQFSSHDYLEWF